MYLKTGSIGTQQQEQLVHYTQIRKEMYVNHQESLLVE